MSTRTLHRARHRHSAPPVIGFEVRITDQDPGEPDGTLAWWQPGAWAQDPMPAPTQPDPMPADVGTLVFTL